MGQDPPFQDKVEKGTVCRYAAPPLVGRKEEEKVEWDWVPPLPTY